MAKKTAKKVKPTKGEFLFNPAEFGPSLDEMIKKGFRLSPGGTRLIYAPDYPGTRLPRRKRHRRAEDENHTVTGVIERDIQVQGHQESRHARIGRLHHLDADDLARSASGEQQARNRPDQSTNALLSH